MPEPTAPSLAETDAELVRDCWTALNYHDTDTGPLAGPGIPHFDVPTPLEAVLLTALVYARLSQYMLYDREVDDEADAIASTIFRGAHDIADVTHDLWEQFEVRVRTIHQEGGGNRNAHF